MEPPVDKGGSVSTVIAHKKYIKEILSWLYNTEEQQKVETALGIL